MKDGSEALATLIRVGAALLLFAGFGLQPRDCGELLRWSVCAVAVYCVFATHGARRHLWTALFGIVAVVFNPLIPLPLGHAAWPVLYIGSALVFLASVLMDPVF